MSWTLLPRALMTALLVVALVGLGDAVIGGHWDLVAVFALVVVLDLALLVATADGRPRIGVRADLAAWLRERSELTGEPVDLLADRVVADYRRSLGDDTTGSAP